jgi:osomolarity two-component system, phosphorelay intermediate protein YPD1
VEDTLSIVDMTIFQQILDLDEDDTHDFSREMVWAYFEQATETFGGMDAALCVR